MEKWKIKNHNTFAYWTFQLRHFSQSFCQCAMCVPYTHTHMDASVSFHLSSSVHMWMNVAFPLLHTMYMLCARNQYPHFYSIVSCIWGWARLNDLNTDTELNADAFENHAFAISFQFEKYSPNRYSFLQINSKLNIKFRWQCRNSIEQIYYRVDNAVW